MSSFSARLRLPGHSRIPLGVEVDIRHERLTLTAGDRTVATWPLEKLEVAAQSDGFHIKVDGEEMVLSVTDSTRFAVELGVGNQEPRRLAVVGTDRPAHAGISLGERHLNRLPTINGQAILARPTTETTPGNGQPADVKRRISDIETALASDSVSPAAAFAQWLTLLKEINTRHGEGSMPTDQYCRLNTQLLDLIPDPSPVRA